MNGVLSLSKGRGGGFGNLSPGAAGASRAPAPGLGRGPESKDHPTPGKWRFGLG